MTDQMHDAGLGHGFWKHGVNRLRKTLQTVGDGDQDILDATVLQLVHYPEPKLGAFRLLDPNAENLFATVGQDAERDVNRFIADKALISDFDPGSIEKDDWIAAKTVTS